MWICKPLLSASGGAPPRLYGKESPTLDVEAGFRIHQVQPLGVIHKELLSPSVVLAHAEIELVVKTPVQLTELGVLVAVGMGLLVLPPQ